VTVRPKVRLQMLPLDQYVGVNRADPIRFYGWPVVGAFYRTRVEFCLGELQGGDRVLEVGFGTGVTFANLSRLYRDIFGLDLTASVGDVAALWRSKGIETHLTNGNVTQMPYPDEFFDAVLLISILEHLRPAELKAAFLEIRRVLKPGGQLVYGVPVERPLMVMAFRVMGYDIREHHFSTEREVAAAAREVLGERRLTAMRGGLGLPGSIYEVGSFERTLAFGTVAAAVPWPIR
jgi:SAM-dependent methyltransferase